MLVAYSGVVNESYLSMLFWTHRFPELFAVLFDPDLDNRKTNMKSMRKQLELLARLMSERGNSKYGQSFLSDLQRPSQFFRLEVFYMVAEIDFDHNLMTEGIAVMSRGCSRSF